MQENKQAKSHKYAPIKFPHTQLLLVLEQNKQKERKQNETKQQNLNLPTFASGISNAHDMLKIIIPTDLSQFNT